MIDKHCFSKAWIFRQREKLSGVDPTLLEKTILAFELLGQLITHGLSFVFKGGTCLLLLLDEFKRLSIDVDIVCEEEEERLHGTFEALISASPFHRWAEDPRTPSQIPKKHYKFFFASQINRREDYVLLDVLWSRNLFPEVQERPINLPFIQTRAKVTAMLPTIDSLIGDKLTAFAPHTIGVPLGRERSMQIVKQLFDLGELFLHATNVDEIAASYDEFVRMENSYRQTDYSRRETLQDALDTCFSISQLDLRGSIENEKTTILRRGVRQIGSHLIGLSYGLLDAKTAASRVAFLAALLLSGEGLNLQDIIYHDGMIEEIRGATIPGERAILNRLKTVSPQSFYYWHLADKLLQSENERSGETCRTKPSSPTPQPKR